MLISVVIPFYNRIDGLGCTLDALGAQFLSAGHFEVIVVNDGSQENLDYLAREKWPFSLRVVQQENRGPASARNYGFSAARGNVLVFLDADIIPVDDFLSRHSEIHSSGNRLLVVGSVVPWAGKRFTPANGKAPESLHGIHTGFPCESSEELELIPFYRVVTQNLSMSRQTFETVGKFDARFRGNEDVEFGYRAQVAGIRIVQSTRALGYHNHPRALHSECLSHKYYASFAPLLIQKHPELAEAIPSWLDKRPIRWGHDPIGLVIRKLQWQGLALPPILASMECLATALEGSEVSCRMRSSLYWRLLETYEYLGYREGCDRHLIQKSQRESVLGSSR